jgi:hypothetical protein
MSDVAAAMQSFRECARHIWNAYFQVDAKRRQDWDLHEEFDEAALILFRALVLHERDVGDPEALANYRGGPAPLMCLRLDVERGSEILVNRTGTSGYWDDLRFIWFFDWSELDFRDFQYCRVRIVASSRYPHLVGRDALLPVTDNVRMFCEPRP